MKRAVNSSRTVIKKCSFKTKAQVYNTYIKGLYTYCADTYFDFKTLRALDDEYRLFFHKCKPKPHERVPLPPSVEILWKCIQMIRKFWKKDQFESLASVRSSSTTQTRQNVSGYMFAVNAKNKGQKFQSLALKLKPIWNHFCTDAKISDETEMKKYLTADGAVTGTRGAEYFQQLIRGELISKQSKRGQILRHFHASKNALNSSK